MTKHSSALSELGPQHLYMLHIHLINCYKNDYQQFLKDLPFLRKEDVEKIFKIIDEDSGETIYDLIATDSHKQRHYCAILGCLFLFRSIFFTSYFSDIEWINLSIDHAKKLIQNNELENLEEILLQLNPHKDIPLNDDGCLVPNYDSQYLGSPLLKVNLLEALERRTDIMPYEANLLLRKYLGNAKYRYKEIGHNCGAEGTTGFDFEVRLDFVYFVIEVRFNSP